MQMYNIQMTHKHVPTSQFVSFSRNQSLYEVQHLYNEQHYEELVEILQETFNYSQQSQLPSALIDDNACPDRAAQLAMLMDALWQLKRYQVLYSLMPGVCDMMAP
jgi:hypothetical protein